MNGKADTQDIATEVVTEYGTVNIDSGVFKIGHVGTGETGARVLQWGDSVALVTGHDAEDYTATVGQRMTPDMARELAETLQEEAEKVELNQQIETQKELVGDDESFVEWVNGLF